MTSIGGRHRRLVLLLWTALVLAACGGGDGDGGDSSSGGDSDGAAGSGDVVDQQPPGQAMVSVDDEEFTFDTPGLVDCNVEPDTFTFSYVIGDNEVTLGGGANLYEDGWLGDITLRAIRDNLPYQYFPDQDALDDGIAIDGDSISYSGPMLMRPPNDGTNPPPESVGEGTISVTCG